MKTKILLIAISFVFCVSCSSKKVEPVAPKQTTNVMVKLPDQYDSFVYGYKVIVLDSCEYIYAWFGMGNGGGSLTHKGNCKFCKARNEKYF